MASSLKITHLHGLSTKKDGEYDVLVEKTMGTLHLRLAQDTKGVGIQFVGYARLPNNELGPNELAGQICPGDYLVAVNGKYIIGMSLADIQQLLRAINVMGYLRFDNYKKFVGRVQNSMGKKKMSKSSKSSASPLSSLTPSPIVRIFTSSSNTTLVLDIAANESISAEVANASKSDIVVSREAVNSVNLRCRNQTKLVSIKEHPTATISVEALRSLVSTLNMRPNALASALDKADLCSILTQVVDSNNHIDANVQVEEVPAPLLALRNVLRSDNSDIISISSAGVITIHDTISFGNILAVYFGGSCSNLEEFLKVSSTEFCILPRAWFLCLSYFFYSQ